ncbi:MAG: acetolactate synthase small subunit [Eubacteriales bacterium]
MDNRWTLSLLVQDIPGVMSQVARLFSRKGYNIHSITSGASHREGVTRMTIVITSEIGTAEQIAAQCRKLIPVLAVKVLQQPLVEMECTLVKVQAETRVQREEIMQVATVFRSNIIDLGKDTMILSLLGDEEKTEAFLKLLDDFAILEIVRTGTIALERGRPTIFDNQKLKEEYNYGKNVLREGL